MENHGLTSESWCILGFVLTPIIFLGLILMCVVCCSCFYHMDEEESLFDQDQVLIQIQRKRNDSVRFLDRGESENNTRQKSNETYV